MNKRLSIILILVSFVLGFVVSYNFFKDTKYLPSEKEYITDTVKVPKPYQVPKPYPIASKPEIKKIYEKDSSAIDSLKLLLSEKDIVISGLKYQLTISQDYLKQFPKNPKLLELNLQRD